MLAELLVWVLKSHGCGVEPVLRSLLGLLAITVLLSLLISVALVSVFEVSLAPVRATLSLLSSAATANLGCLGLHLHSIRSRDLVLGRHCLHSALLFVRQLGVLVKLPRTLVRLKRAHFLPHCLRK